MIYIRIGKENVLFRFQTDAEPLNNNWAMSCFGSNKRDLQRMDKFLNQIHKGVEGELFMISGLNETAMRAHIRDTDALCEENLEATSKDKKSVFKGTTFGHSYNVFGAYAMLLKVGLPDDLKVRSHVVTAWTSKALRNYVIKIMGHLYRPAMT